MNVRYGAEITAAATAAHLDPRLLAAVAAQETGGPGSDSGKNIVGDGGHGRGVFQIDDRSWAFARTPAAMDPAKNAAMAAWILADNLRRYGGDVHAALSAYNAGAPNARGTTTTWSDGATLGYADSVLRHYGSLGGDVHVKLVADKHETANSVNALAAYGAARPAPAAAFGATVPAFGGMGAFSRPPAPTGTIATAQSAADDVGADADRRMAALVSGDDGDDDAAAASEP